MARNSKPMETMKAMKVMKAMKALKAMKVVKGRKGMKAMKAVKAVKATKAMKAMKASKDDEKKKEKKGFMAQKKPAAQKKPTGLCRQRRHWYEEVAAMDLSVDLKNKILWNVDAVRASLLQEHIEWLPQLDGLSLTRFTIALMQYRVEAGEYDNILERTGYPDEETY
eukprot:Skav218752  [mRNA]  locus=scaffold2324:115894:116394:+ [translate_table: standard]